MKPSTRKTANSAMAAARTASKACRATKPIQFWNAHTAWSRLAVRA
jgi:hypothetical protein